MHDIVQEGLPALCHQLSEAGRSLPAFVERELEAFLACGDPAEGFAWLTCGPCDHHRLVTFSCKGRGFCPRCGGRRMAERAARWCDTLLPRVAVRQWVLTVPWARRWELARHPDRARGVLRRLIRRLERHYRSRLGLPEGRTGAVTVIQRFGSALNLNVHFHVLMLDGLYIEDPTTDTLTFRRAPRLRTPDVERLVVDVAHRAERWLARFDGDEPDLDEALPGLQAASVQGRSALSGARARRVQLLGGRPFQLPPRCASFGGYNLHGDVAIAARDRVGLERLCRYVRPPPLCRDRLERLPDGRVRWTLKRAWSHGTTALTFTPAELVERLAALVPPPRANTILYHGLLAAGARDRRRLLPRPTPRPRRAVLHLVRPDVASPESRWTPWAALLRRVFGVDPVRCPRCGESMTLRTVVVRPPATLRILDGLEQAARGPPGARGEVRAVGRRG